MAKQSVSVDQIVSGVPAKYKKQMASILKEVKGSNWRRPESGSGSKFPSSSQGVFVIYLDDAMMSSLRENRPEGENSIVSGKEAYLLRIGDPVRKISFRITAKKGGGAADAKTTAAQERGSIYIFKRVLGENKRYNSAADIKKDKTAYRELQKIWDKSGLEFDDEWLEDYYKQSATLLTKYSNPQFTEFVRDGGFMDWVTNIVREKYQISQKDNWNPADVWLVKNQDKVIKDIEELIDGGRSQTLEELNAILRTLFKQKIVVGVSLKKVSGDIAKWEEVNVDENQFTDYDNMYYKISKIECNLNTETKKGELTFATQDARIYVDAGNDTLNFQIKANDSTNKKGSNLKYEPTATGATAARLGKAPVDMVRKLMIDYNVNYESDHNKYPMDVAGFIAVKDEYASLIETLKKAQGAMRTNFSVPDTETAINNILMVYGSQPHVAKSKLMQIQFLHMLVTMKGKGGATAIKRKNMFMTDMSFLAQKKGRRFGPFGKLY